MLLRDLQSRLGGTPPGVGPLTVRSSAPAPQPSIAWMRSGGYSSPSPRNTQERPQSAAAPSSCSATVAPKVSRPTRASSGSSAAACAAADTASARSAAGTAVSITNKKAGGVANGGGGSVYSTQQYCGNSSAAVARASGRVLRRGGRGGAARAPGRLVSVTSA